MPIAYQQEVDAQGLICPEPVMMLHKAIREIAPGEVVKIVATDPSTKRDIAHFCEFLGHELVEQQLGESLLIYFVKKRQPAS